MKDYVHFLKRLNRINDQKIALSANRKDTFFSKWKIIWRYAMCACLRVCVCVCVCVKRVRERHIFVLR